MIDIVGILERQKEQVMADARLKVFGLSQLRRLNEVIEDVGGYITTNVWDLLLFNVNDLYIKDGKIGYTTFNKVPSKKIIKLLNQYNCIIIQKLDYIMTGKIQIEDRF